MSFVNSHINADPSSIPVPHLPRKYPIAPPTASSSLSSSTDTSPTPPPASYQSQFQVQIQSQTVQAASQGPPPMRLANLLSKPRKLHRLSYPHQPPNSPSKRHFSPFIINKKLRSLNSTDILQKPDRTLVTAYGRMYSGTLKAIGEGHWGDHECLMELHRRGLWWVMGQDKMWEVWCKNGRERGELPPAEIFARWRRAGLVSKQDQMEQAERKENDRLIREYDSIWGVGAECAGSGEVERSEWKQIGETTGVSNEGTERNDHIATGISTRGGR